MSWDTAIIATHEVTIDEFNRILGVGKRKPTVDFERTSVLIHSPYLKNHWTLETCLRPKVLREVKWLS